MMNGSPTSRACVSSFAGTLWEIYTMKQLQLGLTINKGTLSSNQSQSGTFQECNYNERLHNQSNQLICGELEQLGFAP